MRRVIWGTAAVALAMSLASPLLAQEAMPTPTPTPSPTATPSPTTTPRKPAFNPACMQAAVDKRDTAIITALDKYAAEAKAALETRRAALKDAWGKATPKERRTAIRAAWAVYRKDIAAARQGFRKERLAAWKQFRQDAKVCRPASADLGTESGGEGVDQSL